MVADFLITIDSDDEVSNNGESSRAPRTPAKNEELDPDFHFELDGGRNKGLDLWGGDEVKEASNGTEVDLAFLE
jgi:ATP-dependent RNA helicase DDX27